MNRKYSRKPGGVHIGALASIILIFLFLIGGAFALYFLKGAKVIHFQDVRSAAKIAGLKFSKSEIDMMIGGLRRNLDNYAQIRSFDIPNSLLPSFQFNPILPGTTFDLEILPFKYSQDPSVQRPVNPEDLAFLPVTSLAQLIRTRQITSVELTELYLQRLKTYGPQLECVVTLTEDLARAQAQRADAEIEAGLYRGPLHGIPWGAKDLLATKGIKTTWGAAPFKDQVFDTDATVVKKLEDAGAVLVAKLTLGALAMGDYWFGGQTRNPWNLEQGSSGSSAGSAAATSAGLVAFAIGTETLGSIVSPATRCGVTGLRPTFGRVSRNGAMALSWTMDKIGPLCRTVEDCALVLEVIRGPDGFDPTVVDIPFNWNPEADLGSIRVGYLKSAFERERSRTKDQDQKALQVLESLGIELIPYELPDFPVGAIRPVLSVEAAAAFDELTRSGRDDLLVRQEQGAWPNTFRRARMVPAVEYIQANRLRTLLMQEMGKKMESLDVFVAPTSGSATLTITNLTGHPTVVVPHGFNEEGSPTSLSFVGGLFAEAKMLRVAKAYQDATDFHRKHPPLESNTKKK